MPKELSLRQLLTGRHALLAWLVLTLALLMTAAAWYFSTLLVDDRTQARFQSQSKQLKTAIEERLLNYEQVLAGSAGLFAASSRVNRAEWQTYVRKLNLDRYYPGIQGLGITRRVLSDELDRHQQQLREEGAKEYTVTPSGPRREYHPIVFLEPDTALNRSALGYDAFEDPIHRRAMEQARDGGAATMTGKVVLVQEKGDGRQASFLMYFPIYTNGNVPQGLSPRRQQLDGFAFGAFRMNTLIDGIVGLISPFLDVHIYDGDRVARKDLMYASNLGTLDDSQTFAMNQRLTVEGRTWLLQTRTTPAFDYLASDPRPLIVAVAGGIISVLLFAFVVVMTRSRMLVQINAGRYRAITEGASNITLIVNRRGAAKYISPSSTEILGINPDRADIDLEYHVHPDDWPQLQQGFIEAMKAPGRTQPVVHARIRDASGSWRDMEGFYTAMTGVPGVNGVVISLRDMTELKAAQSELHRLAFYDPLTGLANRQLLRDRLEYTIRLSKRRGKAAALMFLDLDGFKRINDTLGHEVGDELLKAVAGWLCTCVREEDSVARLGGDEFVVLLSEVAGGDAALAVAENILQQIRQRIQLGGNEVGVTASIGIAMIPDDSDDPGVLMKYADLAMYRAKEQGRNTAHFFTPAMNIQAERRLQQQETLARALEAESFALHYQPKIDLHTGRVLGVEAFLRWQHPERGLIPAQQFIGLAEETGLILQLGEMTLRQASIQIQALERAGFEDLRMAVNMSVRQLLDPGFIELFRQVVTETGVSPQCLELELPSALLSEDFGDVRVLLGALQDIGVRLILDDFGSCSYSLAAIQRLPLHAVKVDHIFIRDIPYDRGAMDLTSAVIGLALILNLDVIAEGVETQEQLRFLKASGCVQAQGDYFGAPLDEDALIGFLVRQQ